MVKNQHHLQRPAEILDLTHEAIFVRDLNGHITFWNRGATELYGWTENEALGRICPELLQTQFPEPVQDIEQKVSALGRWEGELIHTTKGGAKIIVASRWSTRRAEGKVSEIVEIDFDITAQKRGEEEALQKERLAAVGTAAAILIHEIANPLTILSGIVHMLKVKIRTVKRSDPQVLKWLDEMTEEMARLTALLAEYRSFTKPPAPNFQPLDLKKVIEEVLAFEEPAFAAAQIQVERLYESIPAVMADRDKIRQVLLNIFKNALEAMPGGGFLTVRSYRSDEFVVVQVTDTGVGVPEGVDVFKPFETTKATGAGLGLAVVLQIIAAHGGNIQYDSTPGKGTTFKICLPVSQ